MYLYTYWFDFSYLLKSVFGKITNACTIWASACISQKVSDHKVTVYSTRPIRS